MFKIIHILCRDQRSKSLLSFQTLIHFFLPSSRIIWYMVILKSLISCTTYSCSHLSYNHGIYLIIFLISNTYLYFFITSCSYIINTFPISLSIMMILILSYWSICTIDALAVDILCSVPSLFFTLVSLI